MPGAAATFKEFAARTLHSGSKKGPVVKNRRQAVAIALAENRKAGEMKSYAGMTSKMAKGM